MKRLVVEYTGKLVEVRHSYDDFDRFSSYGGLLQPLLSLDLAVQTRHILQTIQVTRMNGTYNGVLETSTR